VLLAFRAECSVGGGFERDGDCIFETRHNQQQCWGGSDYERAGVLIEEQPMCLRCDITTYSNTHSRTHSLVSVVPTAAAKEDEDGSTVGG
jgi:hypothetical protein